MTATTTSVVSPRRSTIALLGPAFVAAVAYVDPGNFATNISSGANFGYQLLWVVLLANLMAMPVQYVSAKLGIVTGRSLPELSRDHLPRPAVWLLWVQAEIVAMATDVAEFVGAALGLYLLFGVPLELAVIPTGLIALAMLGLRDRGYRRFELTIAALLALVLVGFAYELFNTGVDTGGALSGFVPSFAGPDSVLLAVGVVGATVMPHAVYLHSALTSTRQPLHSYDQKRHALRVLRWDIVIALGAAGLVNMAMMVMAAELFPTVPTGDAITDTYSALGTQFGGMAALVFAAVLLVSGLTSSAVGTYAGQVVLQGYLNRTIPLVLRRLITMAPAVVVLLVGLDPTRALVISQVVLSFGIPFALVPLVMLGARRTVMGTHATRPAFTALLCVITTIIVLLNAYLLYRSFFA
jgi:manganese transport protein